MKDMSEIEMKRLRLYRNKELLKEIEFYAETNYIPIIKPEVANFLNIIIKIKKPRNILEIGTAIGYSAIIMLNSYKNAKLLTIEKDIDRAEIARNNFKRASLLDRVELILGDAIEVLPNLNKKYDVIFIDASKGHYEEFFNECLRILNKDGLLICDNILYKGYIEGEMSVKHKRRTIVYRMRNFIDTLVNKSELTTSIIPIGDGLSLSIKEGRKND
jgi:predicted O-methyltransferase YrrM